MASLKEVRNRIKSISSTQQITKAMKMVAAAKLKRAQDNIIRLRPYADKLQEILQNVSSSSEDVETVYSAERKVESVLLIVVTSDRGLCGGFNSSITKTVSNLINQKYATIHSAGKLKLMSIGKKGYEFFERRDHDLIKDYTNFFLDVSFDGAKKTAEYAMNSFAEGIYDEVVIIYNEFKNVATQVVKTEQFLPIAKSHDDVKEIEITSNTDYIFEPSQDFIVKELIPKSLKIQLYKALLESNASEHGARMTAMDKATDNAGELLKELKLVYNRTRQAAITTEILEIVGGAEALANG